MTQKLIYDLSLKHQKRIIPILVSLGDVKLINPNLPVKMRYAWSNCEPSIGLLDDTLSIDPSKLEEYRILFPPGKRSSRTETESKALRFMRTYPQYSFDDIIRAATGYIGSTDPTYICKSGYFIFKKVPGSDVVSKCLDFLEDTQVVHYDDI